jgi:hypothetical protein
MHVWSNTNKSADVNTSALQVQLMGICSLLASMLQFLPAWVTANKLNYLKYYKQMSGHRIDV